ncbi:hypothetical protein ACH44C_04865 [Streptomyces purpureus]|uniref:hypothetical protein n=1 Tax=Streptomyces purpureus TaxID=1951 RepID=UPI000366FD53|nr:hypothetical protein [Streptomyces purpureus]
MVDVGAVITPPGQYTHCVDREDYTGGPKDLLDAGLPAILEFGLCQYLMGGKLVCLGGDRCAIGVVAGLEAVGAGKKGLNAIDNDFSFNVLLAPYQVQDFAVYGPPAPAYPRVVDPRPVYDDAVRHGPLGWLMADTPNSPPLPPPVDQAGSVMDDALKQGSAAWPVDGYGVLWKFEGGALVPDPETHPAKLNGDNLHKLYDDPGLGSGGYPPTTGEWLPLPVMHCECEGSRIFFVCQAMKPFLDLLQLKPPGGGPSPGAVCRAVAKRLPWPVNKVVKAVCSILEDIIAIPMAVALAPWIAAAFAAAWESAQAFDDLFVTGPVAKQIHVGDVVIVHGRWVWDAGHSGQTELHPVKTILKLQTASGELPSEIRPPGPYDPRDPHSIPPAERAGIEATHKRWCRLVTQAPPPPDPRHPQGLSAPQLAAMGPEALTVWGAQHQPEHSWTIHPLIDGCHDEP